MGDCSPAVATIILSVQVLPQRARATDQRVVQHTHTHTLWPQARLKEVLCGHTWHRDAPLCDGFTSGEFILKTFQSKCELALR